MTSRDAHVIEVVNTLICRHVHRVPIDIYHVAELYGAKFSTLSQWESATGQGSEYVFDMWGNRDGVNIATRKFWSINYNERMPENRIRFTWAEELMHFLLGHVDDHRFNIAVQSYDEETYTMYEAEAKHGASMLLVPPSVYYKYRKLYSLDQIGRLCQASEACVYTASRYYEQQEEEIRDRFTRKYIQCDTEPLRPLNPLHPISVWNTSGIL